MCGPYCCVVLWWRAGLGGGGIWPPAHTTLLVSVPSGLLWCKHLLSLSCSFSALSVHPPPPNSLNRVIINIMHLFLPPPPHHRCIMLSHTTYYKSTAICKVHNFALRYIIHILLGPPGYTQAFPYLRPGPLNCLVVHKTNKPLASRNQHKTNWVSHTASENDKCK